MSPPQRTSVVATSGAGPLAATQAAAGRRLALAPAVRRLAPGGLPPLWTAAGVDLGLGSRPSIDRIARVKGCAPGR